jgi:mRNA interferase MazF
VVARAEIYWATLPEPAGRRPVCILTRQTALSFLERVVCANVTRTIRGIPSEVDVGAAEGLPHASVINCDDLVTISREWLDVEAIGRLDTLKRSGLDLALRFALGIVY